MNQKSLHVLPTILLQSKNNETPFGGERTKGGQGSLNSVHQHTDSHSAPFDFKAYTLLCPSVKMCLKYNPSSWCIYEQKPLITYITRINQSRVSSIVLTIYWYITNYCQFLKQCLWIRSVGTARLASLERSWRKGLGRAEASSEALTVEPSVCKLVSCWPHSGSESCWTRTAVPRSLWLEALLHSWAQGPRQQGSLLHQSQQRGPCQ